MLQAFLITLLCALLLPPLMKWLMRGAQKEVAAVEPTQDLMVMAPSTNQRILVLVCGLIIAIMGVAVVVGSWPSWLLALFFGAPLIIWGVLAIYSLRRRVLLSEDGIISVSPWTGRFAAKWSEIEAVRFREWGQTIRIRINGRERLIIPCSFTGISQLERYMTAHLAPSALGETFRNYRAYAAAL